MTVREVRDCQTGAVTVREVWRLSERRGDCQRDAVTVREVW